MFKNIIQSIVIILGILITISFLTLIYGMYLKISKSNQKPIKSSEFFSSKLLKDEKINNIETIDKEHILILIDSGDDFRGVIYNFKKNEIIRFIDR
tara:strand:+ start:132 stop:419 length:288 start_codon:yes stop_codon:yes gene_type:complete